MIKKYLIIVLVGVLLIGGAYFVISKSNSGEVTISILRSPHDIIIKGDSAKYVGRSQYQIVALVTNNTKTPLVYMPVFGVVKDGSGKKIGLAMGNTGRIVKPGETLKIYLDTVIPKELGIPAYVELYSE